jgi:hypothetical protein
MKLRFRENSVRLRVNRHEVDKLAAGNSIEEEVAFPNSASLRYIFEAGMNDEPLISFKDGVIRVAAPLAQIRTWAHAEATIGLYFKVPAGESVLSVSIEKDLQCIDGPADEFDPDAFPRETRTNC